MTIRIVVGVDGSEDGLRAVRYAATAVAALEGELHLVHAVDDAVLAGAWGVVYDPSLLQQAGEQATQLASDEARAMGLRDHQIRTEVVLGNPSSVLARLSEGAELLVVGRRSLSGLERMFVGSTSVSVALGAKCPVVVISNAVNPEMTGAHSLVTVGIDAEDHSSVTLAWAFAEAQRRTDHGHPTGVRVVHVLTPTPMDAVNPESIDPLIQRAGQAVEGLLDSLRTKHPFLEVQMDVLTGSPVDEMVAETDRTDLFVLGAQRSRRLGMASGVLRGVLAHAKSPVALVR